MAGQRWQNVAKRKNHILILNSVPLLEVSGYRFPCPPAGKEHFAFQIPAYSNHLPTTPLQGIWYWR